MRKYKFDSVKSFYIELNVSKKEYLDYKAICTEYEKIYGSKVADTMSVRDSLRKKKQRVKERGAGRVYQMRQKDKGRDDATLQRNSFKVIYRQLFSYKIYGVLLYDFLM